VFIIVIYETYTEDAPSV